MTNKELTIIKQFIEALVDTAYTRCTVKIKGENCGCITVEDANNLLNRISVLLDEKEYQDD